MPTKKLNISCLTIRFHKCDAAATALEYALIAVAVTMALAVALPGLENSPLWDVFDRISNTMQALTNQ